MTHVLIAVDETESSVEVARIARRLFGADATYLAVNCAHSDIVPYGLVFPATFDAVYAGGVAPIAIDEAASGSPHTIDEAAELAHRVAVEAGIGQAEAIGAAGDPVDMIVRAAHDHHADVIVVGAHGRTWLSRLFEPSVAEGVKRHADVPVMFVKENCAEVLDKVHSGEVLDQ
jgi:nucleotide-binding universal stress UspA family protein